MGHAEISAEVGFDQSFTFFDGADDFVAGNGKGIRGEPHECGADSGDGAFGFDIEEDPVFGDGIGEIDGFFIFEFITDGADDFFDDIFESEEAGPYAAWVADDGDMAAFFLHVSEYGFEGSGFVGEDDRASEQSEFGGCGAGEEQVFEVYNGGGDFIGIDERIATEAIAACDLEIFIKAVGSVHAANLGAGPHRVADSEFTEVEDVFEEQQSAKAHKSRGLGLIQENTEFVFAVCVMAAGFTESDELEEEVGGAVEQEEWQGEECVKQSEKGGGGECGPVGAANGHGFGNEFSDEDMCIADDGVAHGEGYGVCGEDCCGGFRGEHAGPEQEWFDEADDGWFADEAEADGGEGDADLADGEIFVEVILDVFGGAGAADTAVGKFADSGGPHFHGREFSEYEECVEKYE